jgi:hypothetical protein
VSRKQIIDPVNSLGLDIPAKLTPVSLALPKNLSYEEWASIGPKICRVRSFCTWALCDWLNFGEAKYGQTFSQAADATGLQPDYLAILKYVGSRVDACRRRESLSFSHHRLVAPLEPQEQDRLLSEAERHRWTRDDMHTAVRNFRNQIENLTSNSNGSRIERKQVSIPGGSYDSNNLSNGPDQLEPEIMCLNDIEARLRETFFTLDKEARLELIGLINSLLENLQREAEESCDDQGFDWRTGEQR